MGISLIPGVVQLQANIVGGWTPVHYLSAANTNATVVKSSGGSIGYVHVVNTTATIYYLKLYDISTTPTVGTTTPVHTFPIPASTSGAGISLPIPAGIKFSTGISFGLCGGIADNDTSNAAVGVAINIGYA